jgi:hypothetical protein
VSGVYSLVNIPCLMRDLARHPRGAGVAADLLRIAALDAEAFGSLDRVRSAADAPGRREALRQRMQIEPRALQVLAATRDVATTVGIDAWTAAVDVLDTAPMGGLDDLVAFVRDEVCAGAWSRADGLAVATWPTALDVIADRVRATYAADTCPEIAGPLGRPWRRWLSTSGQLVPSADPVVADVLARLRSATPHQLDYAAQGLRRQRAEGWSWATDMHDACWAVHLTGRETVALTAQLHALRALRAALPPGSKPSPDTAAAVVAAVHARIAADVLAGDVLAALTAPLDAALGCA